MLAIFKTKSSKTIKRVTVLVFACYVAFSLIADNYSNSRQLGRNKAQDDALFLIQRLSDNAENLSSTSVISIADELKNLLKRSAINNLVVYDAVGKRSNLALVEHSRRTAFNSDEWDCVVYMYVEEDHIPDDDENLKKLANEHECNIVRTPGIVRSSVFTYDYTINIYLACHSSPPLPIFFLSSLN